MERCYPWYWWMSCFACMALALSLPSQYSPRVMRLSGQPALKVRLAASSKRDGNEWAWVVNVAQTAEPSELPGHVLARYTALAIERKPGPGFRAEIWD